MHDVSLSVNGVIMSPSSDVLHLQDCSTNLAKKFVSQRDDTMMDATAFVEMQCKVIE